MSLLPAHDPSVLERGMVTEVPKLQPCVAAPPADAAGPR
jgi:hypothetical protein